MADNVPITAGSGTTIATDDVAGVHYQRVKIVDGTLDGTGAIGGDATNGLDVDVTRVSGNVTVVQATGTNLHAVLDSGTLTSITNVVQVGDNTGSLTVDAPVGTPAFVRISDGVSAIDTLPVSLASVPSHAVTNAGTFATQVDGAALTALQLIDDPIIADDAAFSVGTSKVMMTGSNAVAHSANPDAADAGDAVALIANRHRIPFFIGGHPNIVSYSHSAITTAVTDSALVTVATGLKIVVTRITVTLDNASTVFPSVRIGFGTASVPVAGSVGIIAAHGGIPAGGGFTIGDGSGILGIGGDDQDLRITTVGTATGNGILVTVSYYTIES